MALTNAVFVMNINLFKQISQKFGYMNMNYSAVRIYRTSG